MKSINTVAVILTVYGCLVATACSDEDDTVNVQSSTEAPPASEPSGNAMEAPASAGMTEESFREQNNLALVETALNGLLVDSNPEVLDLYWVEDFAQHNPTSPNGTTFLRELFIDNRVEGFAVEQGLRMADGDFVSVHSRITGIGEPLIAFDVYKVQDDKIIAHWDSIQVEVPASETANGNAMLSSENTYPPITEDQERLNADIVREALFRLIEQADASALDELFDANYIQHSPDAPNGVEALRNSVANFDFLPDSFSYDIGFVMADGPFVAVQSRFSGLEETATIALDIFRLENGLISEHWDVLQDEVAQEKTVSGNPMFPIQ